MVPENPLLGSLVENDYYWFRPAKSFLSEEDKILLSKNGCHFSCINTDTRAVWGIMLHKNLNDLEQKYGVAKHILTTKRGSPKYIVFENHTLWLGMKPTYALRNMNAEHISRKIMEE